MTEQDEAHKWTLASAERYAQARRSALDYVETGGVVGSLDGLFLESGGAFSHLSGICPHLDFSGIPKLYTAFKEYQVLESEGGGKSFLPKVRKFLPWLARLRW